MKQGQRAVVLRARHAAPGYTEAEIAMGGRLTRIPVTLEFVDLPYNAYEAFTKAKNLTIYTEEEDQS